MLPSLVFAWNYPPQPWPGQPVPQAQQAWPGQQPPQAQPPPQAWRQPNQRYAQPNPWQARPTRPAPPVQSAPPAAPIIKPRVEVSLNETSGYLLQPLVYSIKIYSDVSIASVDVTMPRIDGAAVEQLDGPRSFTRKDEQRRIVTEIRYAITPFKAGDVSIPPARLKLKTRTGPFSKTDSKLSSNTLSMNVLPADNSVNPWLPLADLSISGRHDATQQMKVGDPFTLTFTMKATGMAGNQLPGLSGMLKSDDFKFYPEQPRTSQKLSKDGMILSGKREESFTVIPRRAGALSLPIIDIAYWDTRHHRRARAVWSGMQINVTGGEVLNDQGKPLQSAFFASDYRLSHDLKFFWLPMLLLLLFTAGLAWWMARGRPGYGESRELISEEAHWQRVTWSRRSLELRTRMVRWMKRPVTWLNRSRTVRHLTGQASTSWRVWRCLHCVGQADDARGLCKILRRFAGECLQIPPNSSLGSVADALHQIRPRLDRDDMHKLFSQLNSAAYGSGDLDIPVWKRRFRSLLRGVVFSRQLRCNEEERTKQKLPDLNPQL